jgi:hypothetical protein
MMPLYSQDATVYVPSAYSTASDNYVREWDPGIPKTDPGYFVYGMGNLDTRMRTQYYDGLGRLIQTVGRGDCGASIDLVSSVDYDPYGRVARSYLPFAANNYGSNSSVTDGGFKMNPFQEQQYYYSDAFWYTPIKGQGEAYYYGKTEYEPSPLNRIDRVYAAGNAWVHDGRGIKYKYWSNTLADSVRVWRVTNSGSVGTFGTYNCDSLYKAADLFKNVMVDENNKQTIEFKDEEGKIILKKVQLSSSDDTGTGKGYTGWLCTYYIYDDYNLLRAVIQPRGVELLATNSWNINYSSGVILNEQCFRYEYDPNRRMQMKKVPGAGEVYMVYDQRDRLVLVQDANMRGGSPVKWLYTQYDSIKPPDSYGTVEQ